MTAFDNHSSIHCVVLIDWDTTSERNGSSLVLCGGVIIQGHRFWGNATHCELYGRGTTRLRVVHLLRH